MFVFSQSRMNNTLKYYHSTYLQISTALVVAEQQKHYCNNNMKHYSNNNMKHYSNNNNTQTNKQTNKGRPCQGVNWTQMISIYTIYNNDLQQPSYVYTYKLWNTLYMFMYTCIDCLIPAACSRKSYSSVVAYAEESVFNCWQASPRMSIYKSTGSFRNESSSRSCWWWSMQKLRQTRRNAKAAWVSATCSSVAIFSRHKPPLRACSHSSFNLFIW